MKEEEALKITHIFKQLCAANGVKFPLILSVMVSLPVRRWRSWINCDTTVNVAYRYCYRQDCDHVTEMEITIKFANTQEYLLFQWLQRLLVRNLALSNRLSIPCPESKSRALGWASAIAFSDFDQLIAHLGTLAHRIKAEKNFHSFIQFQPFKQREKKRKRSVIASFLIYWADSIPTTALSPTYYTILYRTLYFVPHRMPIIR